MKQKEFENHIFLQDSRDMHQLPDNSIHLMVTSPPYNVTKQYDENLSLSEYLQLIRGVLIEVNRVLIPGGIVALNIANVGRKPYIPLNCYFIEILSELGYEMLEEVIWDKGASAGGSCAWGSWKSASNPSLRDVHEYIILARKPGTPHEPYIKLTKEDWSFFPKALDNKPLKINFNELFSNVWQIGTESAQQVNHPAPFRVELPFRVIELFTRKGDIVLDPFIGSGSTALAALQAERKYVGYEINSDYVQISKKRIKNQMNYKSDFEKKCKKIEEIGGKTGSERKEEVLLNIKAKREKKTKVKRTKTQDFGVSIRESHDSTLFYSSRLYLGLKINEKQPIIDNSAELTHKIYSNFSILTEDQLQIIPDNSIHLFITKFPSYNIDKSESLNIWKDRVQNFMEQIKRTLITGGRMVILCENSSTRRIRENGEKVSSFFPMHRFITKILINIGIILRGNIILIRDRSPLHEFSNKLKSSYDLAIIGSKDVLKRLKRDKNKTWEKTDTILRDQFLEYTKSIWWPREDLLKTSQQAYGINNNLPYSSIIDYINRFIHLYSFKEDTLLLGISRETLNLKNSANWEDWQDYLKILREKVLFLKIKD